MNIYVIVGLVSAAYGIYSAIRDTMIENASFAKKFSSCAIIALGLIIAVLSYILGRQGIL